MDINSFISLIKNKLGQKWPFLIFRVSLYVILSAIMLKISWNAWPDLVIDFGEELYAAWRITQGDVFYRDIIYLYIGPLSYYWNALWFYLFGTSLNTLIAVNVILLTLLVFLLEDWLTAISNRFSATIAILFFLSVFAFGRYVGVGNYNYITPYLHSTTHGLILILAMLASIRRWEEKQKAYWLCISGVLLGLTLLTKIEISIPAIATSLTYLAAVFFIRPAHRNIATKSIIYFLVATVMPLLITVLLFAQAMSIRGAISGIFSQWLIIGNGSITKVGNLLFYQRGLGTDDIIGNLLRLAKWSWIYLNFFLSGLLLTLVLKNIRGLRERLLLSSLIVFGAFALFYLGAPAQTWFDIARPLPLIIMMGFLLCIYSAITKGDKYKIIPASPLHLASFVFAGTLLLKMALNARIHHYGFVLAMPATMLLIVALISWLPKYFDRYGAGWVFKIFALSLLFITSISFVNLSGLAYSRNDFICCPETGNKTDIIWTNSSQGPIISAALVELNSRLKPGQTFTVVPRGIMLNYLLRRPDPTKYLSMIFDMLVVYAETDIKERDIKEGQIINSFAKNSPDFIVFIHLDTSEHGFNFFGRDFGINLYSWINKNYKVVWQKGDPPLQPKSSFGISIAEKIKPLKNN